LADWSPQVYSIEISPERHAIAQAQLSQYANVRLFLGTSTNNMRHEFIDSHVKYV
jgi:hypothetical protein